MVVYSPGEGPERGREEERLPGEAAWAAARPSPKTLRVFSLDITAHGEWLPAGHSSWLGRKRGIWTTWILQHRKSERGSRLPEDVELGARGILGSLILSISLTGWRKARKAGKPRFWGVCEETSVRASGRSDAGRLANAGTPVLCPPAVRPAICPSARFSGFRTGPRPASQHWPWILRPLDSHRTIPGALLVPGPADGGQVTEGLGLHDQDLFVYIQMTDRWWMEGQVYIYRLSAAGAVSLKNPD